MGRPNPCPAQLGSTSLQGEVGEEHTSFQSRVFDEDWTPFVLVQGMQRRAARAYQELRALRRGNLRRVLLQV